MRAHHLAAVLAALVYGCIIVPPDKNKVVYIPIHVPVGGSHDPGGLSDPPDAGSETGDGGVPPGHDFPGGGAHDSGTDLIWLLRLDPGTATLADAHAALVARTAEALDARGFKIRSIAVLPLYGGAPIWAWMNGVLPDSTLYDALRARAASASGAPPSRCTTDALFDAGFSIGSITGAGGPLFPSRPGALLVALLDSSARPLPLASASCGAPLDRLVGAELPVWLRYPDGARMPRSATRYLLAATSETESTDAMRARCESRGLHPDQLDALAPSAQPFFDPLASGMGVRVQGLALRADLCDATSDAFGATLAAFANDWGAALEKLGKP
jgi:hypothetical protein